MTATDLAALPTMARGRCVWLVVDANGDDGEEKAATAEQAARQYVEEGVFDGQTTVRVCRRYYVRDACVDDRRSVVKVTV